MTVEAIQDSMQAWDTDDVPDKHAANARWMETFDMTIYIFTTRMHICIFTVEILSCLQKGICVPPAFDSRHTTKVHRISNTTGMLIGFCNV